MKSFPRTTTAAIFLVLRMSASGSASSSTRSAVFPISTVPTESRRPRNSAGFRATGGKGSVAIFTAVDVPSGKILWQDRSIAKATFVWADQKLITLDGDGNLMLVHPSPQGFKVAAKAALMTSLAWTPPALVGSRLYLRDRRSMMAVDLG